jgi:2-hydroxy-6-oxonona-2,4-dienedioate hydrolase
MNPSIFSPAGGFSEGMKILREAYADPSPVNFRRLVNVMVYDASFATDEILQQRSKAALANPTHLENYLKPGAALTPPDTMAKLAQLDAPALIIHGRDDRVVSVENSMRIASTMPNATLVVFNRCGHWAQVEHADKFNWLLDGFIQSTH